MGAFYQKAFPVGFIQSDWYCGGRGIPVFVDVRVHFLHGNTQVVCQALNDSDIGLVRDDKINLFAGKGVVLQRLSGNFGQTPDRPLEKPVAGVRLILRDNLHVK